MDYFTDIELTRETLDRYFIRKSIFEALQKKIHLFS